MRVPIGWLKDYVDFEDSPQGLADRLTFSGIEVEDIETVGSDYAGLTVGEVCAVERHPNADRLMICRVFDGQGDRQVVCGAPNVRVGGRYPFAPAGATLPNGMKIRASKLRGVESHGMLCAEDELGLSQDHSGLMELQGEPAPGTPLADVLGGPETVLDLEITPNRPDCLSLIGVAREVAALYGLPLRLPEPRIEEEEAPVESAARVDVLDTGLCPRYTARVIDGVRIAPSPPWMQRRLTHAGIRPINNVVDVTNYVMLECGQPLHAFDHALLHGGRIVVRRAAEGEVMQTLDAAERRLTPDMLVIADADRAVAVAGVMGGAGSEIRGETRTVLLESAWFKPSSVRATSKALGLATESSHRFARGVDPSGVERASRRAAALLAELAGGRVRRGVLDVYPEPVEPWTVSCRTSTLSRLLGVGVEAADVAGVFVSLGLPVEPGAGDVLRVHVPTFRGDLRQEVDLVEEFARMNGLDRIASNTPHAKIVAGVSDAAARAADGVRHALAGLGLREIMNYSLVSDRLLNLFGRADEPRRIRLPNPLSEEHSVLRPSLLPQLVETLGRNRAHQVAEAAFFEFGRVYARGAEDRIVETPRVAAGLMGPVARPGLQKRTPLTAREAFAWIRGIVEELLRSQRWTEWQMTDAEHETMEAGHACAVAAGGVRIGCLGILRRSIAAEWRLHEPIAVAEMDLSPLVARASVVPAPHPPPAHPCSVRDLALVVGRATRHEDVLRVIRSAASPAELETVELFDIFEGRHIGEGRKSMAYSLTYRAAGRTLTDDEVNRHHQAVSEALVRELKAEIRDF